jgi:hypothetical protein
VRALPISPLLLGLLMLPGCPGGDGPSNPKTLYLANEVNTETRVRLVDTEPPPF